MKIDAVGVTSSDFKKTVEFYSILGFSFPEFKTDEDHLEAITSPGSVRLMLDSKKLFTEINGEEPQPGNHSVFALLYDSAEEVNTAAKKISEAGFVIIKEPWDAFWGQRYAVVQDPDGFKIDLFAAL